MFCLVRTKGSLQILTKSFQCFAIIKRRNPKLLATKKRQLSVKRNVHRINDIYSLIPEELMHLKANKPLLMQLDVVYQCIQRFKKIDNNLDIISSLSEDVSVQEVNKWVIPNYKEIIAIRSMGTRISHRNALNRLISCIQLLLASFCCFKLQDPCKFVMDCLVVRFIRNDVLVNKTKNSKIIQRFSSKESLSIKKPEVLKLHCKLLVVILNLKLKTALSFGAEKKADNVRQFFQIICDFCTYIENLLHAFIAQTSSKKLTVHERGVAFNQHYLTRMKSFPDRHVKDIVFVMRKNDDTSRQKSNTLKIVIKQLLKVLDAVLWSLLDDYVKQPVAHAIRMTRQRMHLQSTLLIAGDLDMISEFRLIRWPDWAINS